MYTQDRQTLISISAHTSRSITTIVHVSNILLFAERLYHAPPHGAPWKQVMQGKMIGTLGYQCSVTLIVPMAVLV